MATNPERIRKRIAEIAQRPANVTGDEIDSIVAQLAEFHEVKVRNTRHGRLYRVGHRRFMVCLHNPGRKQIKECYVAEFLDAMAEMDWYED